MAVSCKIKTEQLNILTNILLQYKEWGYINKIFYNFVNNEKQLNFLTNIVIAI